MHADEGFFDSFDWRLTSLRMTGSFGANQSVLRLRGLIPGI